MVMKWNFLLIIGEITLYEYLQIYRARPKTGLDRIGLSRAPLGLSLSLSTSLNK